MFDQLRNPVRLLGDECIQVQASHFDFIQGLLPDRGHARIRDCRGYRLNQGMGRCGGHQGAFFLQQITAINQPLDDAGSRGFGADTGGVPKFLFQAWVVDQLGHVFHRLDQIALGQRFGSCGAHGLEFDVVYCALRALLQDG
ncbi:hypothetical protein D3C81_1461820 [compost metagenome]